MKPHVTLSQLAQLAGARIEVAGSLEATQTVTSVSLDSNSIEPGGLFAALPGTRVHGANYVVDSMAGAILTDEEGLSIIRQTDERRPVLVVSDVREILGTVAAQVYGDPSAEMMLIGVTGTSGKTTTTYLLEQGLIAAGHKVALIGTTGTRIDGRAIPTSLTTPEAPTLQALFSTMRDENVSHVVMEVSSHALELGRVTGAQFDVAGFTNLSQDHLDFHPTMEDYFEAKASFFSPESPLRAKFSAICVDDLWGERMAERSATGRRVGTRGQAGLDVSGRQIAQDSTGAQTIEVTFEERTVQADLPLPGDFNVANATLALALADLAGADVERVARGIAQVEVPGRMERIDEGQDFLAVVDYAHKPAAVAAVLRTLRSQVAGRIGVVVGSGGDRDAGKRPLMGAESAAGADFVVVTDDNPRTEDPGPIRAAVLAGAREAGGGAEIVEVASRREAIDAAVHWARPGDAVIVVGKGHEVGQIVGDTVLHFDDREEVRRALRERGFSGARRSNA